MRGIVMKANKNGKRRAVVHLMDGGAEIHIVPDQSNEQP